MTDRDRLMAWREAAACGGADPAIFFPDTTQPGPPTKAIVRQIEVAKDICARCEVRSECLDFAQRTDTTEGIFGGMLPKERRQLWTSKQR